MQQANGQTPEIYANGIPHYPGECQLVDIGMLYSFTHFYNLLSPLNISLSPLKNKLSF